MERQTIPCILEIHGITYNYMADELKISPDVEVVRRSTMEFSAGGIGETINPLSADSFIAAVQGQEPQVFLSRKPLAEGETAAAIPNQRETALQQATNTLLGNGVEGIFFLAEPTNRASRDIAGGFIEQTLDSLNKQTKWATLKPEDVQRTVALALQETNEATFGQPKSDSKEKFGANFALALTIDGQTYCAKAGAAGAFVIEPKKSETQMISGNTDTHSTPLGTKKDVPISVTAPIRISPGARLILGGESFVLGSDQAHVGILNKRSPIAETRKKLVAVDGGVGSEDLTNLIVVEVPVSEKKTRGEKKPVATKPSEDSVAQLTSRAVAARKGIIERAKDRLTLLIPLGKAFQGSLEDDRRRTRDLPVAERKGQIQKGQWLREIATRWRAEWDKRFVKPELGGATVAPETPSPRQKKIYEFTKNFVAGMWASRKDLVGATAVGVGTALAKDYAMILTGGAGLLVAAGAGAALSGARGASEMWRGRGLASMMAEDVSFKKSENKGWRGRLETVGRFFGALGRGTEVRAGQLAVRAFSIERGAENQRVRGMINEVLNSDFNIEDIKAAVREGLDSTSHDARLFRLNLVKMTRQLGRDREVGYFRETDYLKSIENPETLQSPNSRIDRLNKLYRDFRDMSLSAIAQLKDSPAAEDKELANELTQILSESRRGDINRFGLEAAYVTGRSLTAAAKAINVFSVFDWAIRLGEVPAQEAPAAPPVPEDRTFTPEELEKMKQKDVYQKLQERVEVPPAPPTAPIAPTFDTVTVNKTVGDTVFAYMREKGVSDPHLWKDTNTILGEMAKANSDNVEYWNRSLAMAKAVKNTNVIATLEGLITPAGLDQDKIASLVASAQTGDATSKADAVRKLKELWHYVGKEAKLKIPLSLIRK